MTFERALVTKNDFIVLPGSSSISWLDAGGKDTTPFLYFTLELLNFDEPGYIDFETAECDDVGVIKYRFQGGVTEKRNITDAISTSPLLVMTDIKTPVAYVYPDATYLPTEATFSYSKTGKQDYAISPSLNLVATNAEADSPLSDVSQLIGLQRFFIKGNWHYFSRSILCDTIEIVLRPRIKSGAFVQFYCFL